MQPRIAKSNKIQTQNFPMPIFPLLILPVFPTHDQTVIEDPIFPGVTAVPIRNYPIPSHNSQMRSQHTRTPQLACDMFPTKAKTLSTSSPRKNGYHPLPVSQTELSVAVQN